MGSYGSMSWNRVLNRTSKYTRACAYDRAGILWSEQRASNVDFSKQVIEELHALLKNSQQPAPYLLVGHSLGGAYVTLYANKYPDLIAGVLLLDSSHPDMNNEPDRQETDGKIIDEHTSNGYISDSHILEYGVENFVDGLLMWIEPFPRNFGILRISSRFTSHHEPEVDWSESELELIEGFRAGAFLALQSEVRAMDNTLCQLDNNKDLGDIPLMVVEAHLDASEIPDTELESYGITRASLQKIFEMQTRMHQDQASWPSESELVSLKHTRHYAQFQEPERVDEIIKNMVLTFRSQVSTSSTVQ